MPFKNEFMKIRCIYYAILLAIIAAVLVCTLALHLQVYYFIWLVILWAIIYLQAEITFGTKKLIYQLIVIDRYYDFNDLIEHARVSYNTVLKTVKWLIKGNYISGLKLVDDKYLKPDSRG